MNIKRLIVALERDSNYQLINDQANYVVDIWYDGDTRKLCMGLFYGDEFSGFVGQIDYDYEDFDDVEKLKPALKELKNLVSEQVNEFLSQALKLEELEL